jgi:hypothetical protein
MVKTSAPLSSSSSNRLNNRSHNEASESQIHSKEAVRWFFGMGAVAIIITSALLLVDGKLTRSTKERRLADTLFEMRSAQSSIPQRSGSDSRLVVSEMVVSEMVAGGTNNGDEKWAPAGAVKVRPDTASLNTPSDENHNKYFGAVHAPEEKSAHNSH